MSSSNSNTGANSWKTSPQKTLGNVENNGGFVNPYNQVNPNAQEDQPVVEDKKEEKPKSKRGRPSKKESNDNTVVTKTILISLPQDMHRKLQAIAGLTGNSVNGVVVEYLKREIQSFEKKTQIPECKL